MSAKRRLRPLGRKAREDTEGAVARLAARVAALERELLELRPGGTPDEELEAIRRAGTLVSAQVPEGAGVLVAGDHGTALFAVEHWPVASFPIGSDEAASESLPSVSKALSAVARLEAERAGAGAGFLLVPRDERASLLRCGGLHEHLLDSYAVVADDEEAGVLFDLRSRASAAGQPALRRTLAALAGGRQLAVLDWTDLGTEDELAEHHLFRPPAPATSATPARTPTGLPYLDSTVDVVVVDEREHLEEALRVARIAAVVTESSDEGGARVVEVAPANGADGTTAPSVAVFAPVDDGAPDGWEERLSEAAGDEARLVAAEEVAEAIAGADTEMVVILESGVLPLPGAIRALVRSVAERGGAATGKLIAADGTLAAAGRAVFADGSTAPIGAGSSDVTAAWHEFRRPVPAAEGCIVIERATLEAARGGDADLLDLSERVWEGGGPILYQPEAALVRAFSTAAEGDEDHESHPRSDASGGEDAQLARPERPDPLDEEAWRMVIAQDDVLGART